MTTLGVPAQHAHEVTEGLLGAHIQPAEAKVNGESERAS